jgi:hypothetical protein
MNTRLPTTKAWSWLSPVGPLTTIPILLVFAIGLLVSENVLDASPIAALLAKAAHNSLLAISRFADIGNFSRSTNYPQVALLVSSMHWLLLPIQTLGMIALTEIGIKEGKWHLWKSTRSGVGRVGVADLKLVLIGLPLLFGALIVATMVPGDWSILRGGLTTGSRLGMSTVFLVVFWVTALACNGVYAIGRAFIDFNIRGR